jgi:hypothetical protein
MITAFDQLCFASSSPSCYTMTTWRHHGSLPLLLLLRMKQQLDQFDPLVVGGVRASSAKHNNENKNHRHIFGRKFFHSIVPNPILCLPTTEI